MTARKRFLVSGRVQGVWFRASCREEAERLGLKGWVRNLPDGRVEVVAEGSDAGVAELQAWCGSGPRHAEVDGVEVVVEQPEGLDRFAVL